MNPIEQFPLAALNLLFFFITFVPMEKVFPAKSLQKILRPKWQVDLTYFFGQYLLWNGLVFAVLAYFQQFANGWIPQGFRSVVAGQTLWLQAIEVVILSDFLIYWAHRLQHRVGFLWQFHKVHHSAEHLDWLAAHREHPLDTLYTVGIINLPAFLLGFPLEVLAGLITFRGIWAVFIHSNVRISLGPLRKLIGSPELHHWHHDRNRDAGNYANISPLMDIIFGTYVCPDHEPESFGIDEPFAETYVGQMLLQQKKQQD